MSLKNKLLINHFRKKGIDARVDDRTIFLGGTVSNYDEKISLGYYAYKKTNLEVVNDIKVKNLIDDSQPTITGNYEKFDTEKKFDVVIIGGGVIGVSILRELSKWNLKIALLEKESDVGLHASSRNDGMIHPGFAAKIGSKKAFYNVRGNSLYNNLVKELDIPYIKPGSMIVYSSLFMIAVTPILKMIAKINHVPGCRYVSKKELKKREPYLTAKNYGAFLMPTSGQLSPMKLVTALAENSIENGAEIILNCLVKNFIFSGDKISEIVTNRGNIQTSLVINAAGCYSDWIAKQANDHFFSLHFRKGEDLILDRKVGCYVNSIYAMPKLTQQKSHSKGGGLVKTVEGNILVGPTAYEQPFREDYSTTSSNIDELMKHIRLNSSLSKSDIITYFAGVRACTYKDDFIVEFSKKIKNLIHAAGIQSPGLASAPAIAQDIVKWSVEYLQSFMTVNKNLSFNPHRKKATPVLKNLSLQEREKYIKENPSYGKIICRCEEISEGEIIDAISEPFGAKSLVGIKNRTSASTGRCHGGFCSPRMVELLKKYGNISDVDIKRSTENSNLFFSRTKGDIHYEN